jgi:acid phosphatase (class A)
MKARNLTLAAGALFATCLFAVPLTAGAADATLLLSSASYPPAQFLPAPPADGSVTQKQEMEELHHIQSTMTAADFVAAGRDDKTEDVSVFAPVMGPGFDLKKLPKTAAIFAVVRAEEKYAAKLAKTYFLRNRPWVLDPSLKTCTRSDAPPSSYPSGHATMGYSMAVVLAAMAPDKGPALLRRAQIYAENRLACGVHYRSDIVAGQVLGTVVAEELLLNPKFREDFEAAKAELRDAKLPAQ